MNTMPHTKFKMTFIPGITTWPINPGCVPVHTKTCTQMLTAALFTDVPLSWWMDKQCGLSLQKERSTLTWCNMAGPWRQDAWWEKPDIKGHMWMSKNRQIQGQKVGSWLPRSAEGVGWGWGSRIWLPDSGEIKNVLKLHTGNGFTIVNVIKPQSCTL